MEENTKKETQLSEYVINRLERIDWESLEKNYNIKKDVIMKNSRLATQLANGQVTDYVRIYCKSDSGAGLSVSGEAALRASFRNDKESPKINIFFPSPSVDLTVFGEELRSDKVKADIFDTYTRDKKVQHSLVSGQTPITMSFKDAETGEEKEVEYLVSLDPIKYNEKGVAYRGTNRLFVMPVSEVKNYLTNVAKSMYGYTFRSGEINELSKGGVIEKTNGEFKKLDGTPFDACVQFSVVERKLVAVYPESFRKKQAQKSRIERYENAKNAESQTAAETKKSETKKAAEPKKAEAKKSESKPKASRGK